MFIVILILSAQLTSTTTMLKMTPGINSLADVLKKSDMNLMWSKQLVDPYLRKHKNKVIKNIVKRFDSMPSKKCSYDAEALIKKKIKWQRTQLS
jgi:hypothetical protein